MKTTILSLLVASAFLFSCGNNESKEKQSESIVQEEGERENGAIELNKGEKWKVDAPRMVHIQKMENDAAVFQGETVEEYKALADSLNGNIKLLTSSCTMKGQAHNELHECLLTYINFG